MGIDSMRVAGGRCPPLLVGGLLFACLMLICNWWTLSSENLELLRQIDELTEQIKISAEERDQCVTLRGNLEQKFKHAEGEIASLHVHLEQEHELKKKNDELKDSLTICKSELDSLNEVDATKTATLDALRLDNEALNTTLEAINADYKKLQDDVTKIQEECQEEVSKVKLSCSPSKKAVYSEPISGEVIGKSQLVPESAVKISVAGQRGLKYHGSPILPNDPPGAMRLAPRYSVTMLKAPQKINLENGTINQKKDQEIQNARNNLHINGANNDEDNENIEENVNILIPESDRDQQMKAPNE